MWISYFYVNAAELWVNKKGENKQEYLAEFFPSDKVDKLWRLTHYCTREDFTLFVN